VAPVARRRRARPAPVETHGNRGQTPNVGRGTSVALSRAGWGQPRIRGLAPVAG
jgi:hypothetical protein